MTMQHLKMLEATHPKKDMPTKSRLRVYYGFSKINKIQKREAIAIAFENEEGTGWEESRAGKSLRKVMEIVTERWQTPEEAADAAACNRAFTCYYVFLDDKKIGGSLERALDANSDADKKNVSQAERKEIRDALRMSYLNRHPDYQEPQREMMLPFKD